MAERMFDYNSVGTVYNQMKSINDNIKNLLNDTNLEVQNRVDVCEEAIFGDLGNQLLLSWDNLSSDFPQFVDNFENWSALVAKASGDYSQFEADMAAFNNANPLGVYSAGATSGAVATSSYNDSLTTQEIADIDVATTFYEKTGATYIDTGMVEYAKQHKKNNIIGDVLNVASIALSAVQIGGAVKAAGSVVKAGASAAAGSVDDVAIAGAKGVATSSADDIAMAGTKAAAGSVDDVAVAGGKAAASGTDDAITAAINSGDDVATSGIYAKGGNVSSGIDDAISGGRTMTADGVTHAPASAGGAPKSAADSVFSTMDDSAYAALDDVSTSSVYSKGGNISSSMDDALSGGRTMTADGVTHAPASAHGAPSSAADSAFNVKNTVTRNVTKATDTVKTGVSKVTTGVKNGVTKVTTGVKNGASKVGTKISTAMDKTAVGSKIKAGATNAYSKISSGVKTGVSKVSTGVKNGYNAVKTGVKNGYETVKIYNAANPTYAGKYAAGAVGVNIANSAYQNSTSGYDASVYSNQTQNQSNNQNP